MWVARRTWQSPFQGVSRAVFVLTDSNSERWETIETLAWRVVARYLRKLEKFRIQSSLWVYVCILSLSVMSDSLQHYGLYLARLLCPWDSPGKNTGVGCHALLQGIFLTQGSALVFPVSCIDSRVLYHQHHLGRLKSNLLCCAQSPSHVRLCGSHGLQPYGLYLARLLCPWGT